MKNCDVALIQEPWIYMREIKGLKQVSGELIYSRSIQNPRTCILVKKDFRILLLMHYCSRNLMARKIKMLCGGGPREIILELAYLPYGDTEPPPPRELERLVTGCRALTDYTKALRQAKRESWRRHCKETEKAPECARLQRILSTDGQSASSSLQLENGEYTKTEKGTLQELLRVHFPGSEVILEPSAEWDGLELESLKWKGSREDWVVSRRVVSYDILK
jgi:hypothetical protein